MKNKKIFYGVVGVGHLGNFHAQQALLNPSLNLVGVYDTDMVRGAAVAEKYKVDFYNNLELLLKKCDAVSIVTPAIFHCEVSIKALEHNCHVFIEKPFATSVSEGESIIERAKQKNKLIQVGHIERFNPILNKFLTYSPTPLYIESERLTPYNKRGTDVDVILDLMIHDIDLSLFLFNSQIKTVAANGIKILSDSYDLVNARLEFVCGGTANLTASRLSVHPIRKLRVFEKKIYSSIDLQKLSCVRYWVDKKTESDKNTVFQYKNNSVKKETVSADPVNALYEELEAFSKSILSKRPIFVNGSHGLRALEIALLIQEQINEK